MQVINFYQQKKPVFSFEFFLPKTPQTKEAFYPTLSELHSLGPDFVTLTYGAGGSAREATVEMAGVIKNQFKYETVMHLTCITHRRQEIESITAQLRSLGIENIMALRGDRPKEGPVLSAEEQEYRHAVDLVRHLRQLDGWCLGVAGYPEGHPEAVSKEADLRFLKEKTEAGSDFVTTQLFFDNKHYFDFVAKARALGIRQPIVPGIMPITNYAQVQKFVSMCGAAIPKALGAKLEEVAQDPAAVAAVGIAHATQQCLGLLQGGAPGIHFYTLNKSGATTEILKRLRSFEAIKA